MLGHSFLWQHTIARHFGVDEKVSSDSLPVFLTRSTGPAISIPRREATGPYLSIKREVGEVMYLFTTILQLDIIVEVDHDIDQMA